MLTKNTIAISFYDTVLLVQNYSISSGAYFSDSHWAAISTGNIIELQY